MFVIYFFLLFFAAGITKSHAACADQPSGNLKFVVLSDLHVSPGTASETALRNIVGEICDLAPDFVVVTGDLTNTGSDSELLAVKEALDNIERPLYVIPGNHETNWAESAGLKLIELWGSDRFVARHNGFVLVGFNTGPFMKMGDGLVKQEDVQWLKRELGKKRADENLIAFAHYPLSEGLSNWFDVTGILKKAGCKIVFCGHGHSLRLYNFDGIPGIMCRSVILGKSPVPGYSIVQIRNDSIEVFNKFLGAEPVSAGIALNYNKPDTLSLLKVSPLLDYSVNDVFSNYEIISTISDSASIFTGPCIAENLIVYGNSAGMIKAVDKKSGTLAWQLQVAGPVYSTPVYSGGMIMLGTIDGKIIGIDAKTGKARWTVNTGRPVLAEGITDRKYLYIGGGDREFYKLNCRNGKTYWKYNGIAGLVQGRAAISKSSVLFGAWDRKFYCLDKKTGELKWQWDNGKPQVLYSPGNIYPAVSCGKVFIVAPDRYLTAIDERTGQTIWRTNRHSVRESMGISPDGLSIYAKTMNDTLIAVSSCNNEPVTEWKLNAGFGYEHNPCPVAATDSQVIAGTRDGVLIAMDPVRHEVIWKYKAGNASVNRIAIDSDDTIWFTLSDGHVAGIRTRSNYNQ